MNFLGVPIFLWLGEFFKFLGSAFGDVIVARGEDDAVNFSFRGEVIQDGEGSM